MIVKKGRKLQGIMVTHIENVAAIMQQISYATPKKLITFPRFCMPFLYYWKKAVYLFIIVRRYEDLFNFYCWYFKRVSSKETQYQLLRGDQNVDRLVKKPFLTSTSDPKKSTSFSKTVDFSSTQVKRNQQAFLYRNKSRWLDYLAFPPCYTQTYSPIVILLEPKFNKINYQTLLNKSLSMQLFFIIKKQGQ